MDGTTAHFTNISKLILDHILKEEWTLVSHEIHASLLMYPFACQTVADIPVDKTGRLLIHYACLYNAPWHIVKELTRLNPLGPSTRATTGCVPMFPVLRAGREANIDIVRLILMCPGVPDLLPKKNSSGMCPVHIGAMHGVSIEILDEVLQQSPQSALVRSDNMGGFTPFSASWYRINNCKEGKKAFKNLKQYYAAPKEYRSKVMSAESHQYLMKSWKFIHIFLQAILYGRSSGKTPVKSLLISYPHLDSNRNNESPMHILSELGCDPWMLMFGFYVFSENNIQINYCDSFGRTPLTIAIKNVSSRPMFVMPPVGPCDAEHENEEDDNDNASIHDLEEASGDLTSEPTNDDLSNDSLSMIDAILMCHPNMAKVKLFEDLYPLHTAISSGLEWSNGLSSILKGNPHAISIPNTAKLFPFMLAGLKNMSLDTIFNLLSANPFVLSSHTNTSKKRKHDLD